ncbi:DMT family transporter [Azospirillum sp. SYSU D00513]|uniref:DMT family transporter n=1 Tax=Azospirillum sp. SYSU D00513 TaxID=2812561 RepID=UPI001A971FE6|nr:DMT family transporter [Azospirillum sp. SYSU D00513]
MAHANGAPRGLVDRLFDQLWLMMIMPPLFWAGNAVIGRAAAGVVPPVGLAFWRWFVGALIVLPFAWPHLRADARTLAARWRIVLVLGALGIGVFNTFLYLGLRTTTAINGVMIQSAMPVLIVLMSLALFRDRVTALQGLGILVSLAGAATLIAHGDPGVLLRLEFNGGDLWIFVAVVCYAAYTALLRRRPAVHPLSFVVATFLVGAALLLPFYLWETASGFPMPLSPQALGSIAYTAVCASILAYLCFNRAVALAGANVAGLSIHLVPVFGSLLAMLLLGEQPHLYHAVGIALIAAGIVLASRKKPA